MIVDRLLVFVSRNALGTEDVCKSKRQSEYMYAKDRWYPAAALRTYVMSIKYELIA